MNSKPKTSSPLQEKTNQNHKINSDAAHLPGLAYQHAFDWLAVRLHSAQQSTASSMTGSVACTTPHPWHAWQILRRLPGVHMLPAELPDPDAETAPATESAPTEGAPTEAPVIAIAWLEPWRTEANQFAEIAQSLQPGGYIHLLLGGSLARFLAERRTHNRDQPRLNEREARQLLQQHGFAITECIGLHGWRATAWHALGLIAAHAGFPALQDRCHYAMRRDFARNLTATDRSTTRRRLASPFALLCITAQSKATANQAGEAGA